MDDPTHRDDIAELESAAGRRDLGALTQLIAEVGAGDDVRAVITSKRHGPFMVDGIVREGVGGALKVAGILLSDSARRPDKDLRLLRTRPPSAEDDGVPGMLPGHGSLVRAVFDHELHGRLAVTGVCTTGSADDLLVVGGWVVALAGVPVPRLASLTVLGEPDAHGFLRPPHRDSLSRSTIDV